MYSIKLVNIIEGKGLYSVLADRDYIIVVAGLILVEVRPIILLPLSNYTVVDIAISSAISPATVSTVLSTVLSAVLSSSAISSAVSPAAVSFISSKAVPSYTIAFSVASQVCYYSSIAYSDVNKYAMRARIVVR